MRMEEDEQEEEEYEVEEYEVEELATLVAAIHKAEIITALPVIKLVG